MFWGGYFGARLFRFQDRCTSTLKYARTEEPLIHPAVLPVEMLLQQCEIRTSRRSGPGGQHRNKVETAVIVCHLPSGVQGQASERRNQGENRAIAIQRLRLNLAIHVRETSEQDVASWSWTSRIAKGRIAISEEHSDFPAVLASLLDDLAVSNWDLTSLAERAQTSSSQIVKLLRRHPPALGLLNAQREKLGLSPLS